ncbi:hypothetical protein OOZ15_00365 [Galbibacter sp. EGI 63066]|uniref:hypothetical protein n=1 Tax=Galbibacter sp. EGI 63066 TaxID=2993559 RepID=UPI0022488683|nr:hypothetical protein [Galbibacter sp. EGI 63066]MCX2678382.1 hypothetical protein [Galbibacter sp. EGI 63066]
MNEVKRFLVLSIVINFIILNIIYAQNGLIGKWIELKDSITTTYPAINVLEFTKDKIIQYDFNKPIDSIKYTLNGDVISNGNNYKTYRIIKDNNLELTGKASFNGNDTILTSKLLRIEKTISPDSKNNISTKSIELNWNNQLNILNFLVSSINPAFKISRFKLCKSVKLEELDSMFFISIYCYNIREYVFPIKQVRQNEIVLYIHDNKEIKARFLE